MNAGITSGSVAGLDIHPHLRKHVINQIIAGMLAYFVVNITHLLTQFILSGLLGFRAVLYSHKLDLRLNPGGTNLATITLLYNGVILIFLLTLVWFASQSRRPPIGIPFLRQLGFWLRIFALCYVCGGLIADALLGEGLAYAVGMLGFDKRLLYLMVPLMTIALLVNTQRIGFWLFSTTLSPSMIREDKKGTYIIYVGLLPLAIISILSLGLFGIHEHRMLGMLGATLLVLLTLLLTWQKHVIPTISRNRINRYGVAWPILFLVLVGTCLMVIGRFRGISSTRFFSPVSTTVMR